MSDPSREPVALTPGAERIAILALAAGAFVMALNANVSAALVPFLAKEAWFAGGAEIVQERTLDFIGAAGFAGFFGALLLGPLVDKVGRRRPMLAGMLVFTLASVGHSFAAGDYVSLVACRAVAGFAGGVVYASASAAVADLVPYERRGRAMGVFTAGMFLGISAGLPLGGLLAAAGHWQWIYIVQALLSLLAMLAMFRFLPAELGKGHAFRANLPRLFTLEILASLLSVACYVGAFFGATNLIGTWLDSSGIVLKADQWVVWVVLGLGSAIGSLALTPLSDRIGKRRWTDFTTLSVALLIFALAHVESMLGLVVVGVPLAVIAAARSGPFQALISELVPKECRGTLMGIRSAAVNLGTGLIPICAGRVTTDYPGTLYFSSAMIVVAFLLVVTLVKRR